jgi:hypothetical protein
MSGTIGGKSDPPGYPEQNFALLNDQPIIDPEDDLLGTKDIASGIAKMVTSSRSVAPFVLAVDAGMDCRERRRA